MVNSDINIITSKVFSNSAKPQIPNGRNRKNRPTDILSYQGNHHPDFGLLTSPNPDIFPLRFYPHLPWPSSRLTQHSVHRRKPTNKSSDTIESAALTLLLPDNNKITILVIYSLPHGNLQSFINTLGEIIIGQHNLSTKDSIIADDLNICLLKEDYCPNTSICINVMRAFHFRPIITRLTRTDGIGTLTVIDHI